MVFCMNLSASHIIVGELIALTFTMLLQFIEVSERSFMHSSLKFPPQYLNQGEA